MGPDEITAAVRREGVACRHFPTSTKAASLRCFNTLSGQKEQPSKEEANNPDAYIFTGYREFL